MRTTPPSSGQTLENSEPAPDGAQGHRGTLPSVGGSRSRQWNNVLANQAIQIQALSVSNDPDTRARQRTATVGALVGIDPRDELEGMMAAQLLASHNAAMECYRRAMIPDQSREGRQENLDQANRLSRTFAALVEALNRHRGKGQQKVTVEHVHVHAGGQAVVGMVAHPGGGGRTDLEEQPHAHIDTTTPLPALRRTNEEPDTVPLTRDAERPLPNARRRLPRRASR